MDSTSLTSLPPEIIFHIAHLAILPPFTPTSPIPRAHCFGGASLSESTDLTRCLRSFAHLAGTCRQLFNLLNVELYHMNLFHAPLKESCLRWAVQGMGSCSTLKRAIAYGADVNAVVEAEMMQECGVGRYTDTTFTAPMLHLAVLNGLADVVTFLLANGADVNAPSSTICNCNRKWNNVMPHRSFYAIHTAMHHIPQKWGEKIVPLLIQHGAYRASAEQMVLGDFIPAGWLEVLDLFDAQRSTPASTSLLLFMLRAGAYREAVLDVMRREEICYSDEYAHEGNTLLHGAMSFGDVEVLRHVLQRFSGDLWAKNEMGDTPLNLAAKGGHIDAVRLLLDSLASDDKIDMKCDRLRACPMFHAAKHAALSESGNVDLVNLLMDRAKNVAHDYCSNQQQPLLQCIVQTGSAPLVARTLGLCNTSATRQDINARIAIHHLAASSIDRDGAAEVIQALVDAGSPIDPISREGTPLILALESGNYETAEALLAAGADPMTMPRQFDKSPLHLALLLQSGSKAVKDTQATLLEHLCRYGLDVELPHKCRLSSSLVAGTVCPPLFLSVVIARNIACTSMLLRLGASPRTSITLETLVTANRSRQMATEAVSFMTAVLRCYWKTPADIDEILSIEFTDVVKLLLKNGARLDESMQEGGSAFEYACGVADTGKTALLKFLLSSANSSNLSIQAVTDEVMKRARIDGAEDQPSRKAEIMSLLRSYQSPTTRLLKRLLRK